MTSPDFRTVNYTEVERVSDVWASTFREGHSRIFEYLEITLSTPRLISRLTFEVAHWPGRYTVEYWDAVFQSWLPWDSRSAPGSNMVCDIRDSNGVPGQSRTMLRQTYEPIIQTVQRFRIGARRLVWEEPSWINNHKHPADAFGNDLAYPICIGSLDISYSATRLEEIPRSEPPVEPPAPDPVEEPLPPPISPLAPPPQQPQSKPRAPVLARKTLADRLKPRTPRQPKRKIVYGNKYTYSLHQMPADSILSTPPRPWQCEPQVSTYGVVSLYTDCRDSRGDAQVISRFFMDPLYSGPAVNVYYSNEEPDGQRFAAQHEPIIPSLVALWGDAQVYSQVKSRATYVRGKPTYSTEYEYQNTYTAGDGHTHTTTTWGIGPSSLTHSHADQTVTEYEWRQQYHHDYTHHGGLTDPTSGTFDWIDSWSTSSSTAPTFPATKTVEHAHYRGTAPDPIRHVHTYFKYDAPSKTTRTRSIAAPNSSHVMTRTSSRQTGNQRVVSRAGALTTVPAVSEPTALRLPAPGASYVSVAGHAVDLNLSKSWWVGMYISPHSDSATTGSRPLFEADGNVLYFTAGKINLRTTTGNVLRVNVGFPDFQKVWVVAGYDAEAKRLFIQFQPKDGEREQGEMVDVTPLTDTLADYLQFGKTDVNLGTTMTGGYDLLAFVLKNDDVPTADDIEGFIADAPYYVQHNDIADGDLDKTTDNALLRWHPSFLSPGNPAGFFGGPGNYYEVLSWTPVLRDYRCAKGYMNIPVTKAKYWKFEFTNLIAQPYSVVEPAPRRLRTYAASTLSKYRVPVGRRSLVQQILGARWPGVRAQDSLADALRFADGLPSFTSTSQIRRYMRTEAFHVLDPNTQALLRELSSSWSYTPWHIPDESPVNPQQAPHKYQEVTVVQKTKVGFFAGVKVLYPAHVNYAADNDEEQYVEPFIDLDNVYANSFVYEAGGIGFDTEDGYLSSGSLDYAEAESIIFPSNRKVRGVQFASTQSNASQLLRDNDFNDPLHLNWVTLGDASFRLDTIEIGGIGNTVGIVRDGSQALGGFESESVEVADGGTLHAAARVYADGVLTAPLLLQIVSAVDGTVLVEAASDVAQGRATEWYVGFDVEDFAGVTSVKVRLVQEGTSTDGWYVDDISLYEDPIVWEFSVNGDVEEWIKAPPGVRNNPYGVVTFPHDPSPTANRALRWRVRAFRPACVVGGLVIRPWYEGLLSGFVPSVYNGGGPNLSTYDDLPPIESDSRFQVWTRPIPHDWWLSFRSLYRTAPKPLLGRSQVMMHEDFVSGVNSR